MFNKFKSKSKSDPRSVGNRASPLLVDTYDVATHRGTTSSSSGIFNSNTKGGGSNKKRSSGILNSRSSKSSSIQRRSDGVSSSSSNVEEQQQQRRRKGSDYVIMFLPIIASAFTLALLLVLLQYDKKQQQEYHQGQYQQNQNQNNDDDDDYYYYNQNENNDDGNNNNNTNIATEYLNGYYYTIQEKAISDILSIYEPYWIILVLATVSALLTSIVTLSRNVQVYVYQQRRTHARLSSVAPTTTTTMTTFTSTTSLATGTALGASWCSKGINVLATIVNIVSYLGLLVAVVVPSDSPQRTAQILHSVGALIFFTGTALYAVLHCSLLWLVQGDLYNVLVKLLFTILSVIIVTSSLIFGYSLIEDSFMMDTNNNDEDDNNNKDDADTGINYFQVLPAVAFEWIAVITTAIHTGCFLLLFYIDPVDDEIDDFLMTCMSSLSCCCCCGGGGGGGLKNTTTNTNKRITRQQQKRQQQHGRSAATRNRGEMF